MKTEAEMNAYFHSRHLGPKVLTDLSDDRDSVISEMLRTIAAFEVLG